MPCARTGRRKRAGVVLSAALVFGVAPPVALGSAPATAVGAPLPPNVRRACPIPSRPGSVTCLALIRTDVPARRGIQPHPPVGYGPADLQDAYRLPSRTAGKGRTVAIVNAYDDPNAESDLAVYRAQYGLPPCTTANGCFRKVGERGGSTLAPPVPEGLNWGYETSLDLDMVSAVCPNCRILLVEATSDKNIFPFANAVDTAVRLGAEYVSNSYATNTLDGERTIPKAIESHYDHPGVAITAASGDSGYAFGVQYPAASPYVTAVGGTFLRRSSNARGWIESAWSNAGSGCSNAFPKASWQHDPGCPRRTVADVSAVAGSPGVAVYDTFGSGGWVPTEGTSVATPIIAATYALAGRPAPGTYPASYPYAHTGALNDITTGSNGTCSPAYLCTAKPGYDGPTGLGTPDGIAAFDGGTPAIEKLRHRTTARPVHRRPPVRVADLPYTPADLPRRQYDDARPPGRRLSHRGPGRVLPPVIGPEGFDGWPGIDDDLAYGPPPPPVIGPDGFDGWPGIDDDLAYGPPLFGGGLDELPDAERGEHRGIDRDEPGEVTIAPPEPAHPRSHGRVARLPCMCARRPKPATAALTIATKAKAMAKPWLPMPYKAIDDGGALTPGGTWTGMP
jgi:hypothetical protein